MRAMNLFTTGIVLMLAASAHAAEPTLRFELNDNALSYKFTIENPGSENIQCSGIEISVDVGTADCSETIATYKYSMKESMIPPTTTITNTSFGMDFLFSVNKKSKSKTNLYCWQPKIYQNCK